MNLHYRLSILLLLGFSGSQLSAQKQDLSPRSDLESAVFAGGCFWCMQPPYDALIGKGVLATTVGYSGGLKANPTYEEVTTGNSGHLEVVKVDYDPSKISYRELLKIFWSNIDPFEARGQFCDLGDQYRSAIFVGNDAQRRAAERALREFEMAKSAKGAVSTRILALAPFYPAEERHQKYYEKNPYRYRFYRFGCGRDARLKEIWTEP